MADLDRQSSARPPAKACSSCARAKVRCTWLRNGPATSQASQTIRNLTCDRCHRLKRPCNPQAQPPRAEPIPRSRFGQLERKVDELFQALNSRQPQEVTPEDPPPRPSRRKSARIEQAIPAVPESSTHCTDLLTPASLASREPPTADDSLWPNDEQAEALLLIYRDTLSASFPFVVPPTEPAHYLRRTRPFLFKAMVMAASYQNRDVQKRRATDFAISFTTSIYLDGEKSFDILQGLLVHMAWFQCHQMNNSQMTNLTQLAIAVLADLELNKPVHANDRRKLIYDASLNSYGFTAEKRTLTNDERRALLCCYYQSSTGSTVYCKVDAMEYTNHMHNALEDLLASRERDGDILLAHLVRMQNIVHEITQIIPYDEPERPQARGAPFVMHIRTLEKTLSEFQSSLPPSLAENRFLLMHLMTARVFLFEVCLYDSPWEGTTTRKRLDGLWSCVESLQSHIQMFCSFSVASYMYLPYAFWGQLSHSLLTLSRVCLVDIEGWDRSLIDKDLQFPAAMSQVIGCIQASHEFAKTHWLGDADDSILSRVITKFSWVKAWYDGHVGENGGENGEMSMQETVSAETDNQNTMFLDSRFWEDIMADYQALPAFMKGGVELGQP